MISILSTIACLLEAKRDVKKGDKHDLKSNIKLALIISAFAIIPFILFKYYYGGLIYITVRYGVFDYMYSYIRFKTLFYLGETADMDEINKKINKKLLLILRALLLIGIVIFEIKTLL